MPKPDCIVFPVNTFPEDNQGELNAVGESHVISLSQTPGYKVAVNFFSRLVTGRMLKHIQQQPPNPPCKVEETINALASLGPVNQPVVIGDTCRRCGHTVSCELRKITP